MPSPITLSGSTPFTNPAGTTISAATTDVTNTYTTGAVFTFTNAGVLIDSDAAVNGQGAAIYLVAGNNFGAMPVNLITNTGSINAYGYGMRLIAESGQTNPVVVHNSGTIVATSTQGSAAGIITDQNLAGTVINSGAITGGAGVLLQGNFAGTQEVINLAGGTITGTEAATNGFYGIRIRDNQGALQGTGIIVNYGQINGIADAAVLNPTIINGGTITGKAYAEGAGTLVVDPGAVFQSGVLFSDQNSAETNNAGGSSTIVLAGTGLGTLANPASYAGFSALTVAASADWTMGSTASTAGIAGVATIDVLGTLNLAGEISGTSIVAGPGRHRGVYRAECRQ